MGKEVFIYRLKAKDIIYEPPLLYIVCVRVVFRGSAWDVSDVIMLKVVLASFRTTLLLPLSESSNLRT
jgi:hypothetical protein